MATTPPPAARQGFLRAICDRPGDDVPRLVYADWLEDNGRLEEAAAVRADGWQPRVIRVREVTPNLPASYESRRACRIVECFPDQVGYLVEHGVVLISESDHYAANQTGPKSHRRKTLAEYRANAEVIAADRGTIVMG
jgi:uncharacterized protein (TIGR02996 family)